MIGLPYQGHNGPRHMRPDFLVAIPSWLSGAARSLDVAGIFDEYNDGRTVEEADAKALFCDWRLIGETVFAAMSTIRGAQSSPQTE